MIRIPLTHKGWFGLCPVYTGGTYGDAPLIVERHWSFTPLMALSEALFVLCFIALAAIHPDQEPRWPIRVTGTIPPGRAVTLPLVE